MRVHLVIYSVLFISLGASAQVPSHMELFKERNVCEPFRDETVITRDCVKILVSRNEKTAEALRDLQNEIHDLQLAIRALKLELDTRGRK